MPTPRPAHDPLSGPLRVSAQLTIPAQELAFHATRAGGPGGQHVNTSSTRVELTWDVAASGALTAIQRDHLLTRLASRLDTSGTLRIVSAETRSQRQNRLRALERLAETVAAALVVPKTRKKTRPTKGSVERRLTEKKRQTERKTNRRWRGED
ncbi:MAG: alternative ribosome rescue aminoacyl-tRNA hydrolase ArfB [Candidatus Nanopelagicales bacterium]